MENCIDNNNQQKAKKPSNFLKNVKKVFSFITYHWFFIFFPFKLIKELIYDKLRLVNMIGIVLQQKISGLTIDMRSENTQPLSLTCGKQLEIQSLIH